MSQVVTLYLSAEKVEGAPVLVATGHRALPPEESTLMLELAPEAALVRLNLAPEHAIEVATALYKSAQAALRERLS